MESVLTLCALFCLALSLVWLLQITGFAVLWTVREMRRFARWTRCLR